MQCLSNVIESLTQLDATAFREFICVDSEWSSLSDYLPLLQHILQFHSPIPCTLRTPTSLITLTPPTSLQSIWDANGPGVLFNQQGDVYRGNLQNGRPSGSGVLDYANGCSLHGKWVNGSLEGPSRYYYNDDVWMDRSASPLQLHTLQGVYENKQGIFDVEKGIFPFLFSESFRLGVFLFFLSSKNCLKKTPPFSPPFSQSDCS